VDDLKPCALVTPNGRRVPHVPRLPLQIEILEHNVGRLEHLDRERVRPVLSNRLEQTGDQRGSNDLEFQGLWVSDLHCRFPVVDFIQPLEVFLV
jgi:hypothetical protein